MSVPRQIQVYISSAKGDREVCTLEYVSGRLVEVSASCVALGRISVIADDLFEALSMIRLEMEKHSYFILCNGARIDAYPSRMSRQMGGGGKLYLLRTGVQAQRQDLIDIFDPIEFEHAGTVACQRMAYEAWLRSLG